SCTARSRYSPSESVCRLSCPGSCKDGRRMRIWPAVLLLCPVLMVLAPGCQSMGGPASGADDPPATQAGDQQSASPYQRGPVGIDDDRDFDRPNPVVQTMLLPFRAIGDGFAELFALPVQA